MSVALGTQYAALPGMIPRRIMEAWRQDCNCVRRQSASGYLTPEEFEQLSPNGAGGK
jgi:hypothetical protein